ncbi:hypothetical protein THARTR1_01258 [Trichoderma harzianum]|uniref:BZIP domain-containing protein n=1 Tax=Trichoderma harzianum TaxID=5544 RepID=A0A2K0UMJ8_TRIHA|nr:hypothetical protein THARTR1_01258 [Trichoderma harzianum]
MEHIDSTTPNSEHSADEMQTDGSISGSSARKRTTPKSPNGGPQKLKTSERRRIQNRQAQKTYREKQKKRLQALESFAKSQTIAAHDAPSSSTPTSTIGQTMAGLLAADSPIMGLAGMMQPHDLGSAAPTGMGSFTVGCGPSFGASALSYQTGGPAPMYRYTPSLDYQADGALNAGRSFREDLFSASTPLVGQPGSGSITPGSGFNSPSMPPGVLQSHSVNVLKSQSPARDETDTLLAQFLLQDDITLSRALLKNIRTNKITLKDILRKGLQSLERDADSPLASTRMIDGSLHGRKPTQVQLPDLHANTIRITQMSFVAAVLYNATMLGISAPEMFAHDTESHFYASRKTLDGMEDVADQVAFINIKDDLKPTQNQLTHRHHPYIDTLPFRTFRERLIALINAEPSIINMDELCHDLQSDGVICWGSGAGTGTGHSGAPWDIRSWEVRPWFLKKYWMITEGIEGEMYQQARWWCEMRGEEVPTLW